MSFYDESMHEHQQHSNVCPYQYASKTFYKLTHKKNTHMLYLNELAICHFVYMLKNFENFEHTSSERMKEPLIENVTLKTINKIIENIVYISISFQPRRSCFEHVWSFVFNDTSLPLRKTISLSGSISMVSFSFLFFSFVKLKGNVWFWCSGKINIWYGIMNACSVAVGHMLVEINLQETIRIFRRDVKENTFLGIAQLF